MEPLPSGDTSIILMSGLIYFAATAIPAASPPPLTATKMASKSGTCSRNSTATVPCETDLYYVKDGTIDTV